MARLLTPKEFIKETLLKGLRGIIDSGRSPYLSFPLLALAIEFLGSCLDCYKWTQMGLSEKRYRLAFQKLFPASYKKYIKRNSKPDLYKLRCGLAHVLIPEVGIELSCRKEAKEKGWVHLKKNKKDRLVLILEDFYDDFRKACEEVVAIIDKKSLSYDKLSNPLLEV